ncbi:MAG: hypothetical protein ACFE8C_09010 [Promethearchaeota archaeon]
MINCIYKKSNLKLNMTSLPSKKKLAGALTVLVLGFALIPSGFLLNSFILSEIDKGIAEQICIPIPTDSGYNEWISNDYPGAIPMYRRFYLWNLTNPSEVLNGYKPEYMEIGPYVYREYTTKYDVNFSSNWEEVTYKQYPTYIFEPEMSDSSCSPDDQITNINPAYLGVLELAGTEENLIKVMFPKVLLEVKEMFGQELNITLRELLTNEGIYDMLVGVLNDMLGELFSGILGEKAINLTATWIVDFLTTYIVPLEDLVEFMVDVMPPAEEIFFGEWATDYFPEVHVNLSILFRHLLEVINDLVDFIVDLIFFWDVLHLFDAIKNALKEELKDMFEKVFTDSPLAEAIERLLSNLIRDLGAELVNEEGSETGEGVDIDGREPYNYLGSFADLNITNYNKYGESGITQEQSQALWNPNNPNSLVGMDVITNPIWFEALAGIEERKTFLLEYFNLTETQLDMVLSWIDTSINGWLKNICEFTINDWNSGLITTRTVDEWLFTAIDNLVYEQDPTRAKVGLFDNCFSEAEAESADIKRFTINTGRTDISKVQETIKYDDEAIITVWEEDEIVRGTDGTQFAPRVSQSETLHVFVSDLLRSVDLCFTGTSSIHDIELYRFELTGRTFDIDFNYYQSIKGLANMTIDQGIPIFLSKPHFLDADNDLIESIKGVYPIKELHDTYLDVEPNSGAVMNAAERFQINLMIDDTDIWYKDCWEGVMPILWLEFGGQITEELATSFKALVYGTQNLSVVLFQSTLAIGATLIIPGTIFTTTQNRKRINYKKSKLKHDKKPPKFDKSEEVSSQTQIGPLEDEEVISSPTQEITKSPIEDSQQSLNNGISEQLSDEEKILHNDNE